MTESTKIRRYRDGSIDTEHYMQVGRRLHAEAFRDAARLAAGLPARLAARFRRARTAASPAE